MSLNGAFNNALSGLTTTARAAQVVSSNVANALTPGYGKRELAISAAQYGGVRVDSVQRLVDMSIISDRRDAGAQQAASDVAAGFHAAVSDSLGTPGDGVSLSDAVARLEATLTTAAAQSDSSPRLLDGVDALQMLATSINTVADELQEQRTRADHSIAAEVTTLNNGLARIDQLNEDITRALNSNQPAASLIDERQRLIDQVSAIVPVKEIDRGNGSVALMTEGGAMLVDQTAATLSFSKSQLVTPFQSYGAGTLSGIELNGKQVDITRQRHALSGGTLAAHFEVRDTLAPAAQAQIDAMARDLIERFEDPAVDPTLTPGNPGLLTDSGAAFAPANELGLANRLRVNALVDPDAGGEPWRLRDGLGAVAPGDAGQGAGLLRLADSLGTARTTSSAAVLPGDRTSSGFASDIHAFVTGRLLEAEGDATYAKVRHDTLLNREMQDGVDTDQEMQSLLLLEQSYAANSRVIETAKEMLDAILRI